MFQPLSLLLVLLMPVFSFGIGALLLTTRRFWWFYKPQSTASVSSKGSHISS